MDDVREVTGGVDVLRRRAESGVAGVMIGRAAMSNPWIFTEIRSALEFGRIPASPSLEEKWRFICQHCKAEIAWRQDELMAMRSLRSRLMAYTRGMPS